MSLIANSRFMMVIMFALAFLSAFTFCNASAQVAPLHVQANGPFGSFQSDNGDFFVFLEVMRGGSPSAPSTSLIYALLSDSGEPNFVGSGAIPNGNLTGRDTQTLTLNTDTSKIPGFDNERCDANFNCTPDAPGGVITASWQKTKLEAGRLTVINHERLFGHICFNSSGTEDFVSANAQATVLGQSFEDTFQILGSNHFTSVLFGLCAPQ